ncbi:hypothetical protein OG874_18660 [Nocardia sp. NBC_00565]|uniref:hypothetical protein n=1 Tax=Nocardia sp. NBC_00565 TaxID=2975993 RepID=UPI002E80657A|nr:hypothetical protein [Nocardia sp. NBC_00565]WUC06992.1 hypothetical protein OG874_18660 [Nocardia sp. NBC_00565]
MARPLRPDARTERWREHREKVRGELVDATFARSPSTAPTSAWTISQISDESGCACGEHGATTVAVGHAGEGALEIERAR